MDEYEGADEGFRGLARRDAARRDAELRAAEIRDPGRRAGDDLTDPPEPRPVHRFPIPGYGDPADAPLPELNPASGGVDLPHWAAPPTGEVPLIVPTTQAGGAAGRGSSGVGSHRATPDEGARAVAWRDRGTDWDDLDYGSLAGDPALGALDEQRGDPGEMFSFDSMDLSPHGTAWEGDAQPGGRRGSARGEMGESGWAQGSGAQGDSDLGGIEGSRGREQPDMASPGGFQVRDPMAGISDTESEPSRRRPSRRVALPGRARFSPAGSQGGHDLPDGFDDNLGFGDTDLTGRAGPDPTLALGGVPGTSGGPGGDPGSVQGDVSGGRSSGLVRTATGLGIGVLLLLALKAGPAAALALVVLLVTMAAAELYGVLRKANYQPATLVGLVATVCLMVAVYLKGEAAIGVVVAITMAASLLWYLLGVEHERPTANLAATVLGFLWVGLLGSYAALLLSPALFPDRHGEAFFLGAVIATVAYDVGALVVGAWQGKHPLAPSASPNKTWEGMVGGIVTCLLVSAILVGRIHPWGTANALGLGIIVCVVAPLGDLCESVVKRDLKIKDMGSILPGHGGVLDRLDALLFVVPATFYFVRLLHIGVG